jgi:hypothetical protein
MISTVADIDRAHGRVELPTRVSWSGPDRCWDLDRRRDRLRVYEIVLAEGTDEDVRRFVDIDSLIALWSDLSLPEHVRSAWADHLRRLRSLDLPC